MVDVATLLHGFLHDGILRQVRSVPRRHLPDARNADRITQQRPARQDIGLLEELCDLVKNTSLCGLGQSAPNPVLSTLRYFCRRIPSAHRGRPLPGGRLRRNPSHPENRETRWTRLIRQAYHDESRQQRQDPEDRRARRQRPPGRDHPRRGPPEQDFHSHSVRAGGPV